MARKRKNVNHLVEGTTSNAPARSGVGLRRSNRLNSPTLRKPSQVRNPIAELINLDDNEDEEGPHPRKDATASVQDQETEAVHENAKFEENDEENKRASEKNPEKKPLVEEVMDLQAADERNVEAETKYLVQSEEELKFDNDNQLATTSTEGPSHDLSYRSLYIGAQKKIEVLMEEKFALLQELQFTRGQIAAFEKMKDMFTTREVIVVPGLQNATASALPAQGLLQNQPSADEVEHNASPKAKTKTYKRRPRKN